MGRKESQTASYGRRRSAASTWSERRKNWKENRRTFSTTIDSSFDNCPTTCELVDSDEAKHQSICGIFTNAEIERGILTVDGMTSGKHEEEQEIFIGSSAGDIQRVTRVLRNCQPSRKENLLTVAVLSASWHGNTKLLRLLLEHGGDTDSKDNEGRTALHLAAASNAVGCLQLLLAKDAKVEVWDNQSHSTPLGSAAASRHLQAVELLLSRGADPNAGLNDVATTTFTPLAWAVRAGAVDCVTELINHGANVNGPHAYTESPIHIAALLGNAECLEVLLKAGADLRTVCGTNRNTALHLAAEDCAAECVKVLLSHGADPNVINARCQTPLHLAALSQASEVVLLLTKGGAKVDVEDTEKKTPLHNAIVKTGRCTETVQNLLASGANVDKQDKYGYSPLHLAALNEHSGLVSILIQQGANITSKTKGGAIALGVIARRTPDCITTLSERLDAAVSANDHDALDLDCELKIDFRFLVPKQKTGESLFFMALIQSGQRALLHHPLCRAFLHLKWFRIRKIFFVSLTFYALFVLFLSIFIIETFVLNPFVQNGYCDSDKPKNCNLNVTPELARHMPQHLGRGGCSNGTCPFRTRILKPCNITSTFTETPTVLEGVWWFLLFLSIIFLVKEIFQFFQNPKEYIRNWENWVQVTVVTLTGLSAYGHRTFLPCPAQWQYHTAGLDLVLAWTQMMIIVGRFPSCGLYVQMFHTVAANVLRFILVYLCMVVGFSLGMAVLFPGTPSLNKIPESILTTIVMMVGEMDVNILFQDGDGKSDKGFHEGTGHFVFFAFVILIVIVLMNLLVGLAVSDIQGLQRSAGLGRLVRQARLIDRLEATVFSPWAKILPKKVREIIQSGILLVPNSYNCVFSLRPNDPRDKRLPRDIKESIQRVAVVRRKIKSNRLPRLCHSRSFNSSNITDDLSEDLGDIFEQIQKLNDGQYLIGEKFNDLQEEIVDRVQKALEEQKSIMEEVIKRLDGSAKKEPLIDKDSMDTEDVFESIDKQ